MPETEKATPMTPTDIARVQAYLRKLFGNNLIRIVPPTRAGLSVEMAGRARRGLGLRGPIVADANRRPTAAGANATAPRSPGMPSDAQAFFRGAEIAPRAAASTI